MQLRKSAGVRNPQPAFPVDEWSRSEMEKRRFRPRIPITTHNPETDEGVGLGQGAFSEEDDEAVVVDGDALGRTGTHATGRVSAN